jgi:hypothetical protein
MADVRGVLHAPAGYTKTYRQPVGGNNEAGACGKQTGLTPPVATNSVTLDREVGAHGPYSIQFIEVLKSRSAALHFARIVSQEVPCSQPSADGSSTTWTRSARPYSYDVSVKGIVSATAIIDLLPVRNVVYFNDDVSIGTPVNATAHYEQTDRIIRALDSLS